MSSHAQVRDLAGARALIFDVDGTLYRTGPVRRHMLGRLLLAVLRSPRAGLRTLRILKSYRKAQEAIRIRSDMETDLAHAQRQWASERCGVPVAEIEQVVTRWMEEEPLDLLRRWPHAGMLQLIEEARRRGIQMAVVSDYPSRRKLQALGLESYFEQVICAQDPEIQVFKPHPRGLETALQRLGVKAGEAIYIGDRPEVDGLCAERAGTRSVMVGLQTPHDYRGSGTFAADFRDLAAQLWPAASREAPAGEGMRIA